MNPRASNFDPTSGGGFNGYYSIPPNPYGGGSGFVGPSSGSGYTESSSVDGDGYYSSENGVYIPAAGAAQMGGAHNSYVVEEHWQEPVDLAVTTEAGSYYPIEDIQCPLFYGTPVSAVAYDETFDAIYAATVTKSGTLSPAHHRRFPQRSTMMVTHNLSDSMLYSSVASHPEAPAKVLNAIYRTVYSAPQPALPYKAVPNHAFQPAYGRTDPALPDGAVVAVLGGGSNGKEGGNYQLGVTSLIPLAEGTVASVSPAGVRIHAVGGMQLADHPIEGVLSATPHPQRQNSVTHLTVGGMAGSISSQTGTKPLPTLTTASSEHHLHCVDLWQGLRIVTSHTLDRNNRESNIAVTAMATSHSRGCVAVGCSDGYLRLVDDCNRDLAKIKSHTGGVVDVAISDDGTLVATTGYGSAAMRSVGTPPYGYPHATILVNDIRYLGRGGFPHPFAGLRGGPRHLSFLPDTEGQAANSLLVASGQAGGGCQILVPFQYTASTKFIIPRLNRGESINCMSVTDDKIALGTNQGKVLQYRMSGFQPKMSPSAAESARGGIFIPPTLSRSASSGTAIKPRKALKQPLIMPPFEPSLPAVPIEASLLLNKNFTVRAGIGDKIKSIFGAYILTTDPTVSSMGYPHDSSPTSFGPLATNPLVAQCRFQVSTNLVSKASHTVDFVQTIPSSALDVDIFEDHRPNRIKDREKEKNSSLQNPNKFIYNNTLFKVAYSESLNKSKRYEKHSRQYGKTSIVDPDSDGESDLISIPHRYRLTLRPTHKSAASFGHSEYNRTGTIPGFDYPITLPNAFVPPVVMLCYFIPELREAALKSQIGQSLISPKEQGLLTELGYLFHRIETLARCASIVPANQGENVMTRVEAWAPLSFISCLSTMPEAERFQILDGSPAAVDSPRRPEAFYRFLMYQLDNEINRGRSGGLLDSLSGIDFVSINEFISGQGPPSKSTTRQLTLELSYDFFFGANVKSNKSPCFGDVLQYNLCRATRLRAWNQCSKSYETIVQRKIATSLPSILSLSAACAGRKEAEGLALWKNISGENNHWLPEIVEVELEDNGSVVVRELVHDEKSGTESWKECRGKGSMPSSISTAVNDSTRHGGPLKRRYRLDAVVSMIRDDMDRSCPEEVRALDAEGPFGHHVLHARVQQNMKNRIIKQQRNTIKAYLSQYRVNTVSDMTLVGRSWDEEVFQKRLEQAEKRLAALDEKGPTGNDWVLVNGFVVSDTVVEDARAFHVKFKEPALVIFRAIDDLDEFKTMPGKGKSAHRQEGNPDVTIPPDVIRTSSLTNSGKSPYAANQRPAVLPGHSDLVAFDAEFVAVAGEESTLTVTGSKVTVRETRHALARISVIDGRPGSVGSVIFDDHVQPNEVVSDYLTRFSGIVAQDLSPKHSKHHLITARAAYLKLRCFVDRGCIFVGHGLQQDFWTANLAIPASQIIDTVDIYHKPAQRYISLRFLTNLVLKRDVQKDVHDSVEDALAAFELYQEAVELKRRGDFDRVLDELYEYGQKNDWKLGVDGGDD